ncbi:hypothetical protein [Plantactinospora sp. WMMB782]|uniref:hypothetical protein n=1 Tax=Plantactinospora sp. WMMB782 TaxID=3404121 RepID=UPI003B929A3A
MDNELRVIDLQEARELVDKAIQEAGEDFVYNPGGGPNCLYVPNVNADADAPSRQRGCLVGTALKIGGAQVYDWGDVATALGGYLEDQQVKLTAMAGLYFRAAQVIQDDGGSWGAARQHAERVFQGVAVDAETSRRTRAMYF